MGSVGTPLNNLLQQHHAGQSASGVDQFFDYASFMWSDGGIWSQIGMGVGDEWMNSAAPRLNGHPTSAPANGTDNGRSLDIAMREATQLAYPMNAQMNQTPSSVTTSVGSVIRGEDGDLLTYFLNTVVPPILAEVETQKKWTAMRRVLLSMAAASTMVRYSILAFSNLLRCRRETPWLQVGQHYYENATAELAAAGDTTELRTHTPRRQDLLATLFFLCYVDILEERMEVTHTNLKWAYAIFRQGDRHGFHPVEMHLLSWIRLLDARAVSAGGEGLFLSDTDEKVLVQPSPGSLNNDSATVTGEGEPADNDDAGLDRDIEDVLFELLYQPGIVFYQKVQSFMGRISKIDPWHRTRGTVEDETEVMNIAAGILRDLRALSDSKPTLMNHAVAGKLKAPHVSPNLAFTITRAFRTYLSNYHASKVHLHRVAYRHLPLTGETIDALAQIRHLARLMVEEEPDPSLLHQEGQQQHQQHQQQAPAASGVGDRAAMATSADGAVMCGNATAGTNTNMATAAAAVDSATLPVNMLWPLLMWGSEEKDLAERAWIKEQILRMEKIASNARATAQVLEEVQKRQDANNVRQDIRAIMHTVFDSCWAIV